MTSGRALSVDAEIDDNADSDAAIKVLLADIAATVRDSTTRAATFTILSTAGSVLAAAGLAAAAQDLVTGHRPSATALITVAAGGIARTIFSAQASLNGERAAARVRKRLRRLLTDRLLDPRRSSVAATPGRLLTEELDRLSGYFARFAPARKAASISCLLVLAVVLFTNWGVALLLTIATPFLPINIRVIGGATARVTREQIAADRHLSTAVSERVRALRSIRRLNAAETESQVVAAAGTELTRRTMRVLRLAFLTTAVTETVITVTIAVAATVTGLELLNFLHLGVIPQVIDLREGLLLLLLCPIYFQPLRSLSAAYHDRAEAVAAASALLPVLRDATLTDDDSRAAPRLRLLGAQAPNLRLNATVQYPTSRVPVLDAVELVVGARETVAVIGASGSGKTTLLRAIAGWVDPDAGAVTVAPTALGAPDLGWLGQDAALFSGTLRHNVSLDRAHVSRADVDAATGSVGLAAALRRRGSSVDDTVSANGHPLSAGERQRVILARLLAGQGTVWLLDEPTAHLDEQAEAVAIAALVHAWADKTVVVATHSYAVARVADRILNIADGRLHQVSRSAAQTLLGVNVA